MHFDKPDPKTMFLARYGSPSHIEQAIDQKHPEDTRGAHKDMIMSNPFSTKEQLTKITPNASDLSDWGFSAYRKHRNIPDHVKDYIMKNEHEHAEEMIRGPAFTKEDLNKYVSSTPYHSRKTRELLNHPLADHQTYMNALDHPDTKAKIAVFDSRQRNIDHSHVKKAMQDKDEMVRWAAIKHPSADIEEIEHAAKHDPSPLVRLTAIKNEYAPRDLIKHVSENDQDEDVKNVAKRLLEN